MMKNMVYENLAEPDFSEIHFVQLIYIAHINPWKI